MNTTLPFKVKAKYGWSGQTKEDLGFLEGDIMEVTRITGDWYYGKLLRNKKCMGYFPHNFVVILEERSVTKEQHNPQNVSVEPKSHSSQKQAFDSSLPPIPVRETNSFSKDSSKKRSSRLYYSKPNMSTSNNNIEKHKLSIDTNSSRFYEHQHSSSPELHSVSREQYNNSINTNYNRSTRSQRKHHSPQRNTFVGQSSKNPLPPLPQLLNGTPTSPLSPMKSFSSNDIPSIHHHSSNNHYNNNSSRRAMESQQSFRYSNKRYSYESQMKSNSSTSNSNTSTNDSTGIFSNSKYMDSSLTDSENSFALMSDFSATSAGSFARHKHAQSFADSLEKSQSVKYSALDSQSSLETNKDLRNSNNGKMGDLLRRFMPGSSSNVASPISPTSNAYLPKLPSIQNLNLSSNNEAKDWITVKSHINRSRTLTKYEKHPRYMRILEENRELVLHPQDAIYAGLNTNEIKPGGKPGLVNMMLTELNCEYIDAMTRKRCSKMDGSSLSSWTRMTFSARYKSTLDLLRGLYIFCAERFELIDDNSTTDFTCEPSNLDQVLHSRYCTPYQLTWLFKKLANTLGIVCEIVIGFLKTPDNNNYEFKFNHCWLRVLVNREWRFIDVILGNVTNPIHEFVNNRPAKRADDSYFLMEPLDFIYTHIPPREFEQHIVPSLDQLSVLYLPLVFPSFFQNNIKLYNYSTALSYLEDTEIFECSLEIPNDIEVFTSVVVSDVDEKTQHQYGQMELSLAQIKKHKANSGRRIAILKAILPPDAKKGTLYIHSGVKGQQKTRANVHPLSMIVPLEHKGIHMKYEFVVRVPSENVQNVEMYVKEPQNRYLFPNNDYNFEIVQTPFDGIMYDTKSQNKEQSMAIKSPSGEIYKLHKRDPQTVFGTWETKIKVKEQGVWTALVVSDSGLGWCPFAEWLCT
ncbi:cytokinesis protein 3 [Monosporozyma servazzii]